MISQTATAKELYSNFVKDRDIVFCFLDFHEIKESPGKTQKLVIDLLMSGQEAESTFAKAIRCRSDLLEKNKPCSRVALRYCKILLAHLIVVP